MSNVHMLSSEGKIYNKNKDTEMDTEMSDPADIVELRRKVEEEIKDHPKWCGPNCKPGNTFLPYAYRQARLVHGHSAKTVQDNYDLCHIFR